MTEESAVQPSNRLLRSEVSFVLDRSMEASFVQPWNCPPLLPASTKDTPLGKTTEARDAQSLNAPPPSVTPAMPDRSTEARPVF